MNKEAQPIGLLSQMAMLALKDSEDWFPSVARSVNHHTLSLCGEAGELANLIKKVDRGSLDGMDAKVRHDVIMEIVDVFIYTLNLAALFQVDLEKAYEYKRANNVKRFGLPNGTLATTK